MKKAFVCQADFGHKIWVPLPIIQLRPLHQGT
jgi:hypothetical protein